MIGAHFAPWLATTMLLRGDFYAHMNVTQKGLTATNIES
jgi:hypothetical protein